MGGNLTKKTSILGKEASSIFFMVIVRARGAKLELDGGAIARPSDLRLLRRSEIRGLLKRLRRRLAVVVVRCGFRRQASGGERDEIRAKEEERKTYKKELDSIHDRSIVAADEWAGELAPGKDEALRDLFTGDLVDGRLILYEWGLHEVLPLSVFDSSDED